MAELGEAEVARSNAAVTPPNRPLTAVQAAMGKTDASPVFFPASPPMALLELGGAENAGVAGGVSVPLPVLCALPDYLPA
jgi:hypothetical protein